VIQTRRWYGALLGAVWLAVGPVVAAPAPAKPPASAIASAHPLATEAGHEILAAGGNAFDAAVAVSAALAVVEPFSSGLGGGGFWLLHDAKSREDVFLDARETAPLGARRAMYLDREGNVIPNASLDGARAAAIPGVPAALDYLAKNYGKLSLAKTLAPAIRLAREGYTIEDHFTRMVKTRLDVLRMHPAAASVFLVNNEAPVPGTVIKQLDLANTLEAIANKGRDGFYKGFIGAQLVDEVRRAGGLWATDDLFNYDVKLREPIVGNYRGFRIVSAPPPSSGGVVLLEILNILSEYDLPRLDDTARTHLIIEAMRRAYRDRAEYFGDPEFVQVPVERLIHPWYAAGLRAAIRLDRATPSSDLPTAEVPPQGAHTTHYSILDKDGNRVAATVTLNFPFGSGFMVPGTGVMLNDEMDDFSVKPGVPNGFGLVGAEANAIAPGKRPLSSMTPTFVEGPDGVAILGTPGGSRIISMVLLGVLDLVEGHAPDSWVAKGRYHHQYLPDAVQYEEGGLPGLVIAGLRQRGHRLEQTTFKYGNMQAIYWDRKRKRVLAASDPRGIGSAQVMLLGAKNKAKQVAKKR